MKTILKRTTLSAADEIVLNNSMTQVFQSSFVLVRKLIKRTQDGRNV